MSKPYFSKLFRRHLPKIRIGIVCAALVVFGLGAYVIFSPIKPDQVFYPLHKMIQESVVALVQSPGGKASLRIKIAQERLDNFNKAVKQNGDVDMAATEAQIGLELAKFRVNEAEVDYKDNLNRIKASDLISFLNKLKFLIGEQQRLLSAVEPKIIGIAHLNKVKSWEDSNARDYDLVSLDINDLQVDQIFDGSYRNIMIVHLVGTVTMDSGGNKYHLISGKHTYTVQPPQGVVMANVANKIVGIDGYIDPKLPTTIVATNMTEAMTENSSVINATGIVKQNGDTFLLLGNDASVITTIVSTKYDLSRYIGRFIYIEGIPSGNLVDVTQLFILMQDKAGNPMTPALSNTGVQ